MVLATGIPMRVWADRHKMTIVARDGLPVEDNGPHVVLHRPLPIDLCWMPFAYLGRLSWIY